MQGTENDVGGVVECQVSNFSNSYHKSCCVAYYSEEEEMSFCSWTEKCRYSRFCAHLFVHQILGALKK